MIPFEGKKNDHRVELFSILLESKNKNTTENFKILALRPSFQP